MQSLVDISNRKLYRSLSSEQREALLSKALGAYKNPKIDETYVRSKFNSLNITSSENNIFNNEVNAMKVLEIISEVASMVRDLKLPTTLPQSTSPSYENVTQFLRFTYDDEKRVNRTKSDKIFIKAWESAADEWEMETFNSDPVYEQFVTLRTLLGEMYGLKLADTLDVDYYMVSLNSVTMVDKYGFIFQNFSPGNRLIMYLFILITSFLDMIDEPERHVFSTTCGCIVCKWSPEYVNILDEPYLIRDNGFYFIALEEEVLKDQTPTLIMCKNQLSLVALYSAGGVVKLNESLCIDGIIDLLNRMFKHHLHGILITADDHDTEELKEFYRIMFDNISRSEYTFDVDTVTTVTILMLNRIY